MITQVGITKAGDYNVDASDGNTKNVIGTKRVGTGDVLWSMGNYVFSPGQPGSRPPLVWSDSGYHFADAAALKMYYTDAELTKLTKTTDISRPEEDGNAEASLLLHCYSKAAEYFVWLIAPAESGAGCRCLVQRNGKTIQDFISVFPALPSVSDAEVDAAGLLQWVALAEKHSESGSLEALVLASYVAGPAEESPAPAWSHDFMTEIAAEQASFDE